MRSILLPCALWMGCSPSGSTTLDKAPRIQDGTSDSDTGTTDSAGDTGQVEGGDSGSGDGTGEDGTGGGDPPGSEGKIWTGSRYVVFPEYCDDMLTEEGQQLSGGDAADYFDRCPTCTEIYELSVSPEIICLDQVPVATTTYRGLEYIEDGRVLIHGFSLDEEENLESYPIAEAVPDEDGWNYSYEGYLQSYIYYVDGEMQLSQ
jgi:hypothetical protein